MKDKLNPTEIGDMKPQEGKNKWDVSNKKSSSSLIHPTKPPAKNLEFLAREYLIEITDRITNETEKIIRLPWPQEIRHETWVNFDDALDLRVTIIKHAQKLILWGTDWNWIDIHGVVSKNGIMFKNAPVSNEYN